MELPRFVVFKSNYSNKFLRYIHEDVQVHGFQQFSGEEVVRPYVKYEVQLAKSGKGLVHIRCCYNNKYWVRWSSNQWWIVAGADEPQEDQSKWSCTLFEPIYVDGDGVGDGDAKNVLRFRHVQLGNYACLWRASPPYDSCLLAGSTEPDKDCCDVYTVIDWESLLILPKHVAFKGDNGKYLSACTIRDHPILQLIYDDLGGESHPFLKFISDDIGDPTVGNEIFTTHDGSVRIKSDFFGKFWRRSPNWIWADSDDTTTTNSDTLFGPIKVANNVVALRNLGNNNFCKRLTTEDKTDCLNAAVPTISRETHLAVEELVISRNIYNVNFRILDARIYNKSVLTMATEETINNTHVSNTVQLKFSHTETKSSTWNASVSLKLGVKTSFQAGIPFIGTGAVEISAEVNAGYQWGETQSSTTVVETVHTVVVPPRTKVSVHMRATQGTCDVPFSYSQHDTLTNGKTIPYNMFDGVYTGTNCFNFQYVTEQEDL